VQKFDWLRDVTPEEEGLMKQQGWDLEDASLAPVDKRYTQPALNLPEEDHVRAITAAAEANRLAKAFAEGGRVRCCIVCRWDGHNLYVVANAVKGLLSLLLRVVMLEWTLPSL
jgi:hypothetical protein